MAQNWLEETWGPIFEKEEKAKKFSFKEAYQKKELGKDWYEGEIDKARNIWKHTPEGVKNVVTGTASSIGQAYSETMWKARRGLLGPHAFVGSHAIDTIGKATSAVTEFATEQVHDKLGIHKPLARGGVMAAEALLSRKIPKGLSKIKQTAGGYKEALYGLGGTGGAGATRGAGKVLSKGVPNYLKHVDTSQTGFDWIRQGGGLQKEIAKILKGKKGKSITYEELVNQAKTSTSAKNKLDKLNSLLATGPAQSAEDVLFYGYKKSPEARTALMKGTPDYSPQLDKSLEFHHKGMKSIQTEIHQQAQRLRDAGDATDLDLLNLHGLSNAYGAPSGSRLSAAEFMHRIPHDVLHKKRMLPAGIQPDHIPWSSAPLKTNPKGFPPKVFRSLKKQDKSLSRFDTEYIENWSKTIGIDKAVEKWKNFKFDSKGKLTKVYKINMPDNLSELDRMYKEIRTLNIKELHNYQKMVLDEITMPMTKEASKLEDFASTFSPSELHKFRVDKTPTKFNTQFDEWLEAIESKDSVKVDEFFRQLGGGTKYK